MAIENTFNSTPLDDLKDLVHFVKQSNELLASELEVHNIYLDDSEALESVDGLVKTAISMLAKHVPGMSCTDYGLDVYESEESRIAANTYDDGSPVCEHFNFPEHPGLSFEYMPRHNGPREDFMSRASMHAEQYSADVHARTAVATGKNSSEKIYVEFTGEESGAFSLATHVGDDPGYINLDREQLLHLREGIDRVLDTEQKETGRIATERKLGELMEEAGAEMQARIPEILEAVTAGTATEEQLGCVVAFPDGLLKTWENVTPEELETLRRAHSF